MRWTENTHRHAKKFPVPTHVRLLNWRVRGHKTGRSLYDLLADRSREHTQHFPRVSVRRCNSPKTGYQLYRPQFLTSCTLLANIIYSIDVLNRSFNTNLPRNFHDQLQLREKKDIKSYCTLILTYIQN